jgi:outer membrane protein assembly factor BamB/adenine/guanine phosphoribosyltransferase-like PRPP-binding protein
MLDVLIDSFLNDAVCFCGKSFAIEPEVTLHNGPSLHQVGKKLWAQTQHLHYTHIVAPGAGSGPLAAAIALAAQETGYHLHILQLKDPARYPERKVKRSGLAPEGGARALLVDDCVLNGRSVRNALAQLAAGGIAVQVVAVATFYDHEQLHGSRQITASGMPIYSVLKRTSLGLTRAALTDSPVLGEKLWARRGYQLHRARSCAPRVFQNLVIVADDSCRVWGVDLQTGDDLWCIEPLAVQSSGINNDFLIVDGYLYFSTYAGEFVKALAATGHVIWRRKVDHACHSSPVFDTANNRLYLNCESSIDGRPAGALRAFDATNGQQLWAVSQADFAPCQPAFDGQRVFATCNQKTLMCVDTQGNQLWQATTSGLVRGSVLADPSRNTCITCSENGYIQCFDAATGTQLWSRRTGASSNHVAPYWANGDVVVSDGAGYLFAVNPESGRINWVNKLRSPTAWRPSQCEQGFLVATKGGNVARFSQNGAKLAEQSTQLRCFAPAALGCIEAMEIAVFLTLGGQLVCHKLHPFTEPIAP